MVVKALKNYIERKRHVLDITLYDEKNEYNFNLQNNRMSKDTDKTWNLEFAFLSEHENINSIVNEKNTINNIEETGYDK